MGKLFVEVGSVTVDIPQDIGNATSFDYYFVTNDGYGFFQLLFLGAVYAYILFNASNLISDGEPPRPICDGLAGPKRTAPASTPRNARCFVEAHRVIWWLT